MRKLLIAFLFIGFGCSKEPEPCQYKHCTFISHNFVTCYPYDVITITTDTTTFYMNECDVDQLLVPYRIDPVMPKIMQDSMKTHQMTCNCE